MAFSGPFSSEKFQSEKSSNYIFKDIKGWFSAMSDYQKMGLRKNPFQQLLPETTLQRPVHFGVSPILRGRNGGGSAPKCENSELCFPNAEIPIFFCFFFNSENPVPHPLDKAGWDFPMVFGGTIPSLEADATLGFLGGRSSLAFQGIWNDWISMDLYLVAHPT